MQTLRQEVTRTERQSWDSSPGLSTAVLLTHVMSRALPQPSNHPSGTPWMRTLTPPGDTGRTPAAATERSQWGRTGHRGLGPAAVSWAPTRYRTSRGPSKKGPELISVSSQMCSCVRSTNACPSSKTVTSVSLKAVSYFDQKAVSPPLVDSQSVSAAPGLVAQSCPTLCDRTDCGPPGSSVHGILQARVLEWAAMPSSRGSSPPHPVSPALQADS